MGASLPPRMKINKVIHRISKNIAEETRLHDFKAADVRNDLQMLNFHQLYTYAALNPRYYDTEDKSPMKTDRLLRQTERYYNALVFTKYEKRS